MSRIRAGVEPWVRSWWAGGGGLAGSALSLLAMPLEALYAAFVALRGAAYRGGLLRARRASIPIVSVGNLVVGGTGKTPVTAWLARRLQEMGARPAVLLRGYGEDEVKLHRRWNPGAPVIAGPNRVVGAARAAAEGATIALLDDGLQHRRLARDLEVVLVAAEQPFPGRLLPRGPYREGSGALERADLVAVTRRTAGDEQVEETLRKVSLAAPRRPTAVLRLAPRGWSGLTGEPVAAPRGAVLAVASVAEPALFVRLVEGCGVGPVELLAFPDHHAFVAADAERIGRTAGGRTVVVTEKDAVKLEKFAPLLPAVRVLILAVHPERGERALEDALRRTTALAEAR